MLETEEEIADLQRLLDASIGRAGGHLTGIVGDESASMPVSSSPS